MWYPMEAIITIGVISVILLIAKRSMTKEDAEIKAHIKARKEHNHRIEESGERFIGEPLYDGTRDPFDR